MNQRILVTEIAALVAIVIWVYAGVSLLVAAAGAGATVSVLSIVAVVALPYAMSRWLGTLDISERALRLWGALLSVIALTIVLRIEINGASGVFDFGWLPDVLLHTNSALEDQGGTIMTVLLLSGTWLWCVIRARTSITVDRTMTETGAGLVVVLAAAAFADAADAPAAVRWLPAPFMVASLLALALLHARPTERDKRALLLLSPSLIWTVGALVSIAVLATVVSLIEIPSPEGAADALGPVARAIGLAFAWTFSPLFFVIGWLFDHVPWPFDAAGQPQPQDQPPPEERPEEGEPAQWSLVLGYVVRTALIVLIVALAIAVIWFAFGRFSRRRDGDEVREDIAPEGGSLLDGLRSMLPGLPRRGARAAGRDAIGRLYVSMLRAASQRGLERPQAATPLEFSPQLDARFSSPVPSIISRAYSEARYAARPPDVADIERLREQWRDVVRDR